MEVNATVVQLCSETCCMITIQSPVFDQGNPDKLYMLRAGESITLNWYDVGGKYNTIPAKPPLGFYPVPGMGLVLTLELPSEEITSE